MVSLLVALILALPMQFVAREEAVSDYNRVYLASFPRSGSHWMREMIEDATGIATSSVYCDVDPPHMSQQLPWKGFSCVKGYRGDRRQPEKGEIVVLKTHYPYIVTHDQHNEPPLGRTVCIVRHPIDTIYSYYVYSCHLKRQIPVSPIPQMFFERAIKLWQVFYEYWDGQLEVEVFRYEDFLAQPFEQLEKMLFILGYHPFEEKIRSCINKYPPSNQTLRYLPHYTKEQLALVSLILKPQLKKFNYEAPFK